MGSWPVGPGRENSCEQKAATGKGQEPPILCFACCEVLENSFVMGVTNWTSQLIYR